MFSQFGVTAESLSRASALVFRIGTDAGLYDDPDDVSIAPLLDSRFDSERVEALKRLLALIAQGSDVSNFFPQVVKNVASPSLEVKKLVYLYLLHYAEKRQNEALLSINCFQKDLSDINPLVRAWALRAMAGIRLHVVAPLVLVAVSKCAKDPSAYVRKCAANAIPKLYAVHPEGSAALEELVSVLLCDHSPGVVGAAAAAFNSVCPNNLSLIGKNFKGLCETLPDVEEWGQVALIDIILRFLIAGHGLVRESIMFASSDVAGFRLDRDFADLHLGSDDPGVSSGHDVSDGNLTKLMFKCYMEGQEEHLSISGYKSGDNYTLENSLYTSIENSDVRILLKGTSPLLWSRNSAVVLAAAGVHWIMAPRNGVERIVKPVLFLLRSSPDSKYVVLRNIQVFAKVAPLLFAPYFEDFFCCSSDSYWIKALKLEILSLIATESTISAIFEEFQDYVCDMDRRFVAATVDVIGICARRLPLVAKSCVEALLALVVQNGLFEGESVVVVQAIMSIKSIIKGNPNAYERAILRLAQKLEVIKEPVARSLIVWIVGEYHASGGEISRAVTVVLKHLAWSFSSETTEVKLQIMNAAAKVAVNTQGEELAMLKKILGYILELAKYDSSYDIRDRARVMGKLIFDHFSGSSEDGISDLNLNKGIYFQLMENNSSGNAQQFSISNWRFYLPGSLSQTVLHAAPGYGPLPKPCSLDINKEVHSSDMSNPQNMDTGDDRQTVNPAGLSGTPHEKNRNTFNSEDSNVGSNESEDSKLVRQSSENDHKSLFDQHITESNELPLVSVSHDEYNQSFHSELGELMSKSALESWLNEQPGLLPTQGSGKISSARISIYDLDLVVKPKVHSLLEPINGHGLKMEYTFSPEISTLSPFLICVEVTFGNFSDKRLTHISLKVEESDGSADYAYRIAKYGESPMSDENTPTTIAMEDIASLDPGQTVKRVLQVRFFHHLLPLNLAVLYNNKQQSIKLWPEMGYFMRPLSMDMDAFILKESQLPGMFEYVKRCTFKDHIDEMGHQTPHTDKFLVICRALASKVLSNANVRLVCVDTPVSSDTEGVSGTRLRFSGEILGSKAPCLISIVVEGGECSAPLEISVKINCEDTVFGLNLLNRLVAFL